MTKPHSDEAAIVAMAVTMAAVSLSFLAALGYLLYRFWPAIVALFD
jgi:hypothetical protein